MTTLSKSTSRPLSPHLQVYRLPFLAILSVLHRLTGLALVAGTVLLSYWLLSLAAGPESYHHAQRVLGSMLGQLLLFLWTWALLYHLANGIRHLFWDAGQGFELTVANETGRWVFKGSIIATFVIWLIVAP